LQRTAPAARSVCHGDLGGRATLVDRIPYAWPPGRGASADDEGQELNRDLAPIARWGVRGSLYRNHCCLSENVE
jgi:hypothetical protein